MTLVEVPRLSTSTREERLVGLNISKVSCLDLVLVAGLLAEFLQAIFKQGTDRVSLSP